MEMFLVAVGFYGIGVLTMLLPHGMQRAAHWLAAVLAANINNALRLFGRALPESFYLLIGEYTAQSPFYLAL